MRAAPPASYYAPAEGKTGGELRLALHTIIRNHKIIPYSSSTKVNTSDALKVLDEDPADTNSVWLLYAQRSQSKTSFGLATGWNREHQWCDSYALDGVLPAYSDLHNLRAEDANVNSARGNKYYDVTDPTASSYRTPAHTEAPLCSTDRDSWEPPNLVKGDIARALFYMAVRYTGDVPNEPKLQLTDKTASISSSTNLMGRFTTLLEWHFADPVSAAERVRNDRVYSLYQANRNPFVDHPEWVAAVFIPPLTVESVGTNLVCSWTDAAAPTMRIEQSTDLTSGWVLLTNAPVLTGDTWTITLPRPAGLGFYRQRLE